MKNSYEVRGEVTAIFLRRKDGTVLETIIDTADLEKADSFPNTWYARLERSTKKFYAVGKVHRNNKSYEVALARFLMDPPEGMMVDHINHDTLDNRRSVNLRNVTPSENSLNRKGANRGARSKYRGVSFDKQTGKWRADFYMQGKLVFHGLFDTEEEAARAVSSERKKVLGYDKEVI